MRFWDSSAIVPLLVPQATTAAAERWLGTDSQMLVWWGTSVECISALARLEREGALSSNDVGAAQTRLRSLAQGWHEVQPQVRVRAAAERLLRVHPLRAADALQLAAALEVAGAGLPGVEFLCLDRRLSEAAAREGLIVIQGGVEKR
jgi:predicted nucleic acid-binding protein